MITFRPHIRADIPFRVKWLNNKNASVYAVDDPGKTTDIPQQTKWFDDYEQNPAKSFLTICDDITPIGFMGLTEIDNIKKTASIFILIGEDEYRGKGIGKTALQHLIDVAVKQEHLVFLNLGVDKRNIVAIKLYQSLNFFTVAENDKEIFMRLDNGGHLD
ncbi:MAG: GNAT family N-acetyltransferase [Patescibacteria group bacterium]